MRKSEVCMRVWHNTSKARQFLFNLESFFFFFFLNVARTLNEGANKRKYLPTVDVKFHIGLLNLCVLYICVCTECRAMYIQTRSLWVSFLYQTLDMRGLCFRLMCARGLGLTFHVLLSVIIDWM